MTRRQQLIVLGVLMALLVLAIYIEFRPDSSNATFTAPSQVVAEYVPLPVVNPSLRLDELDRIRKLEYAGVHRNIFSVIVPPPPPHVPTPAEARAAAAYAAAHPPPPPPPPPLSVPATFFGYVTDARTGHKQAFFTDGDDVFIAGEGELLLGRFRVLKIGNDTAEVEEVSSGRTTTLTMQDVEPAG
jgi:hypothetical protein